MKKPLQSVIWKKFTVKGTNKSSRFSHIKLTHLILKLAFPQMQQEGAFVEALDLLKLSACFLQNKFQHPKILTLLILLH